jgi:iron complex outermembrane receptor protein
MSLDNVKRIEIIRGPGSALYGANAFEGVINIITKEAKDIDGWELTAGGGSYDTQQYNLLYGKTFSDLDIAFNYNYFNTHGFNKHINEDYLSTSNSIRRRIASLAPKRIKSDDEQYDVSLNLQYKGFTFDGKYVDKEQDLPVSVAKAMTNRNKFIANDYFLTISYERTLWEDLDLYGKVYRNHNRIRADYQILPPSMAWFIPYGPSFAKDGEISVISLKNNRTGIEFQATYRMSDANTIVAGTTYEEMKQYDTNWRSNFLYSPFTGGIIPLPSVRDRSNIQNHFPSVKRNFKAFFVEDIWDITDDLRLTLGVRWDDYSDFGSEVSPRAGLTWGFKEGYDLKLLYGHAFRAPSFEELYNRKVGNPDLDAETIDTYEISLGAEFSSSLSGRVTFFHNEGDDIVDQFRDFNFEKYKNHSKMRSQGFEVEARYDLGRGSYLALNYTYQRWMSPHTKERNWWAPKHLGNVMANIRLSKYLNFFAACHIEDGFRRDRGDTRDDMSGFAVVNTTLIAQKFLKEYEGLELRGSVYNLFDKDYTNPEVPALPNDMPQPGRNFIVEVKYKF